MGPTSMCMNESSAYMFQSGTYISYTIAITYLNQTGTYVGQTSTHISQPGTLMGQASIYMDQTCTHKLPHVDSPILISNFPLW